jgi:WD40 repeat protein
VAQVFISYSRRDKEFVQKLAASLKAEKREVWLDEDNIEVTAEWLKEIFSNIEAADNFLFVISPDSIASPYARKEIDHAVINGKRMVPIYYRAVPDADIPEAVARFQRIDFTGPTDFDSNFAKLTNALDTDLDWKQTHTRLLTRAREWERNGTDGSFLLRGKDLSEAEQWIVRSAEKEPKPTALHAQYILASRQAATKTQRIIIAAVAIALVVAIGLAIYAFSQRNTAQSETREAKARELTAFSTGSLSDDPEKSILLGMQAVNATLRFGQPSLPAAEDALHQALLSSQVRETLKGHTKEVFSVAWSPDGKRLATASSDGTAKVWDAVGGRELLTLKGHTDSVFSVAWSPDGKRLATASFDRTVKVWDAISGQELLSLKGHTSNVLGVAWSPDGRRLATASSDGTAKVWDAAGGRELLTLEGHTSNVSRVAWSPEGSRLATASTDGTAKVWDAAGGQELLTLKGHTGFVLDVTWSPNGTRLATASWDQTAKVWDAASGQEVPTLKGHTDIVSSLAWSPDSKRLATASNDVVVQIYAMDVRGLIDLARKRVTRDFTRDECERYFQSEKCPPLP